jgi:site-specific recombinase XerC
MRWPAHPLVIGDGGTSAAKRSCGSGAKAANPAPSRSTKSSAPSWTSGWRNAPNWPHAGHNPALFLNAKGGRLTARAASGIIHAIAHNAALDDQPTAHVLRHTLATTLVRGHTDLVIVAELLGQ